MPGRFSLLRRGARAPLIAAAAFTFMLLPAGATRAQSSQSARDARRVEIETRQRALWDLEKLKNRPPNKSTVRRPTYRDVEEDFEQLQVTNYSLSGSVGQGTPLDYALIRKEAAEVNKRALRLRVYLSLPKPEDGQKQKKGAEAIGLGGLSSAVASLDALVNSFVWNPVFRRPDVVDAEQSLKASRDLDEIISLSERIRKCAEDLAKGAGKK